MDLPQALADWREPHKPLGLHHSCKRQKEDRMTKVPTAILGMFFCTIAHAQEFDFNGAVLGMKLTEFQALPPINGKLTPDGKAGWCDQSSGKLVCHRVGDDPFGQIFGPALGDYHFDRDKSGELRLYMIVMMADRRNYPIAEAGLTQKWGEGKAVASTATNGLGQEIKATSLTWRKPGSSITLEAPCGTVKYLCLTYTHDALSNDVARSTPASGAGF